MTRLSASTRAFLPYALAELDRRTTALENELLSIKANRPRALLLTAEQHDALYDAVAHHVGISRTTLEAMRTTRILTAFARLQAHVVERIVTAHDLLDLYRDACSLRSAGAAVMLTIADAVAQDSYRHCHEAAARLGLPASKQRRHTPLVHLEPQLTPAAVRHFPRASFRSAGRYREIDLPIPIVVLPVDHIAAVSLLTTIHHEIGHIIQQEVGFTGAIADAIARALASSKPRHRAAWRRWAAEIVADVFGLFLGHIGYVDVLASMLIMSAASGEAFSLDDEHPPPVVRIELLRRLLASSGLPRRRSVVPSLVRSLGDPHVPSEAAPYMDQCAAVAGAVLDAPLGRDTSATLRDLFDTGAADAKATMALANEMLSTAAWDCPAPRLLPSAARLAVLSRPEDLATVLEHVQKRALGLFDRTPPPSSRRGPRSRRNGPVSQR